MSLSAGLHTVCRVAITYMKTYLFAREIN